MVSQVAFSAFIAAVVCGLVGTASSLAQPAHQGTSVLSHGNVRQQFRPPRLADADQRCTSVSSKGPQNSAIESTVHTGPTRVIGPPMSQQSSTVSSTSNGARRGVVVSSSQKMSGGLSGSHVATASGTLRQMQLTDATSLPARVQQQLYLGN